MTGSSGVACKTPTTKFMNRQQLEFHISEGCTQREIANLFGCSQSTIRHWLKKYELKTQRGPHGEHVNPTTGVCPLCGPHEQPIENFYLRRGGKQQPYCKTHHNEVTYQYQCERRKQQKVTYIKYKGRYCEHCGYDGLAYPSVMEFHHTDPTEKDFEISNNTKTHDEVLLELDKCQMLCANCHRAEHTRLRARGPND